MLPGVGSLTSIDDQVASEELLSSNFLIPFDENVYRGKTLAELCFDSLKEFNPMVRVSAAKGYCFDPAPFYFVLCLCIDFLWFFRIKSCVLLS